MLELVIAVLVAAAYVIVVATYASRRIKERAAQDDVRRAM